MNGKKALLPGGALYQVGIFKNHESGMEGTDVIKIRTTGKTWNRETGDRVFYVFRNIEKGNHELVDVMAEEIMIPGNPKQIASGCVKRARIEELLAILSFAMCYLLNLAVVYYLFNLWIR